MRAPKNTSPDTPSDGQFAWHQSRTAGVSYFTHLLSWAQSRSALSTTTDASTTQQVFCEYNTLSGICRLPPRTVITGARVTAQLRFSILWRNFSRRASCRLIRCPHVRGHTWRTCPKNSTLQQACIAPSISFGSAPSGSLFRGHGPCPDLNGMNKICPLGGPYH